MTAYPKAAVQNARVGTEPNVRLWPKAAVREHRLTVALVSIAVVRMIYFVAETNVANRPEAAVRTILIIFKVHLRFAHQIL